MADNKIAENIRMYLEADYPVTIYAAKEGGYVAEIEDLPGCLAQGETVEEAYEAISAAKRLWIETAYEDGVQIPLPRTEHKYSGKWVQRVPRWLHQKLAEQARREGVSLNQYCGMLLAAASASNDTSRQIYEDFIRPRLARLSTPEVNQSLSSIPWKIESPMKKYESSRSTVGVAA